MSLTSGYELRNAVAATFPTTNEAHEAEQELKNAGFDDTWIGLVKRVDHGGEREDNLDPRGSDVVVESESWFQRLFGEGRKTLHDVLAKRGFASSDIAAAEHLDSNSVILTVDSENDLDSAMRIIRDLGGRLLSSGMGDALEGPKFKAQTPYGEKGAEEAFPDAYGFVRR